MRALVSVAIIAALFAALLPPATAQERDVRRLELERIKRDIEQARRQQQRLQEERTALARELKQLSERLVELARKQQQLEARIAENERRMKALQRQRGELLARLKFNHDATVRLVAVMQRLQQDPPPPFVTSTEDVLGAVRGAMMLGRIVPQLDEKAQALRRDLARLERLTRELEQERARHHENLKRLEETAARMEGLLRLKRDLLARTEDELAAERKRLAALHRQARTLEELLRTLEAQPLPQPPRPAPKPKLAPRPQVPVSKLKGRLPWPAQGKVLVRFGERTKLLGTARGVYLATRPGAVITAPAAGIVRTAGPYRTYGHIVYLDVGEGYRILLAGMERTVVKRGEKVMAGAPLGMMGKKAMPAVVPGGDVDGARPILYMEFRKRKQPLDPAPWWLGGLRQARKD